MSISLEASGHLADAQMNAGAEGNVTGRATLDVKALGFVPSARIAIGGGQEQQYLRVPRDFDPADVDRAGIMVHTYSGFNAETRTNLWRLQK